MPLGVPIVLGGRLTGANEGEGRAEVEPPPTLETVLPESAGSMSPAADRAPSNAYR